MKKFIAIGLSFAFIGASIIPFSLASRDKYHAMILSGKVKAGERRFTSRFAPFDTSTYNKKSQVTQYTRQYQRSTQPVRTTQVRSDRFIDVRSDNIPFYLSLPEGFSQMEDTLDWSSGLLKYEKEDATIEIRASEYRCDGGGTYQYYCLEEGTKDITNKLISTVPNMKKTERRLISLQVSDLGQPRKSFSAWYHLFEGESEKIIQLTFLEPTHQFLWTIEIRAENIPKGFLSDDRSAQRIVSSLFRRPTLSHLGGRRFSTSYKYERTNEQASKRAQYQPPKTEKQENKMIAQLVPFDIEVPRGFYKTDDNLHVDSGEMLIRDRDGATIRVIATDKKCEGDPQSRDSAERRTLRECLETEAGKFTQVFIDNAENYHVLHNENFAVNLTFNNKIFQESGRYMMVDSQQERKVLLTFREPTQGYVWTLEMAAPKRQRAFLTNTQEIKRIISSLFFHASVVQN